MLVNQGDAELVRRKYLHPPVVEAIASVHWSSPSVWNIATPGLLYEGLKDVYDEDVQLQRQIEAGVFVSDSADVSRESGGARFSVRPGLERLLFSFSGRTRLLGMSPQEVSVHSVRDYEGWESLAERLHKGVERAMDLLALNSATCSRASLRYINRVEIPSEHRLDDYLTISLPKPAGFPERTQAFLQRMTLEYPEDSSQLTFTWASVDSDPSKSAFVLDFDLSSNLEDGCDIDKALRQLEALKARETQAFESVITDQSRKIFVDVTDAKE